MEFAEGYEAPKQGRFESCESLDDLIASISESENITGSNGHEYQSDQIISIIQGINDNIKSGAYDKRGTIDLPGGSELFQSDLLKITRTDGIRAAAEKFLSIELFRHQRSLA